MAFDITFRGIDRLSPVAKKATDKSVRSVSRLEKSSNTSMKSMTAGFRNAASFLAPFGIAAGAGIAINQIKNVVKEASNLEESVNAVNVVFGQGSSTILKFGENSARAVGLATSEFNQLSAVTGALLKDVGLSERQVALETIELTKRASDLASVFNTSVEDALSAVNQAIRGETEAIRRYAGDITEATLKAHLLSKGLDGNVKALSEQEKRLLRVEVLMKQTDVVAGDFAKTSGNLANQQRILDANLKNIQATLGEGLVPVMANATSGLNNFLEAAKRGTVLRELYIGAQLFLGLNPDWEQFVALQKEMQKNGIFSPEVQENIEKFGAAMSGDIVGALKQANKDTKELSRSTQEMTFNWPDPEMIQALPIAIDNTVSKIVPLAEGTMEVYRNNELAAEAMNNQAVTAVALESRMEGIAAASGQFVGNLRQGNVQLSDILALSLAILGKDAPRFLAPLTTFTRFAGFEHGTGPQGFTVPPGYPNDSFVAGFSSGERLHVTPANQTTNHNNSNVNVNIVAPELHALNDEYILETRVIPKLIDSLKAKGAI